MAADLRDGRLDLALFYLDDRVVAGDLPAVGAALAHVQQRAAAIGLSLPCEVVVPSPATADLSTALPAPLLWTDGGVDRVLSNFEFLGAAIGICGFVAAHTAKRGAKTTSLIEAIAELEDPQMALRLLRACAGHSRLLHSVRRNPPSAQQAALEHFDTLARDCFSGFTGLHLVQGQWLQATRGLAQGGLGLRSTSSDASAAYLASVGGCAAQCQQLDAHYGTASSSPHVVGALAACNRTVGVAISMDVALASRQRALVAQADLQAWQSQLATSCPARKELLLSEAEPGGRAFLAAVPAGRKRMEPAVFTAELRQAWVG